MLNDQYPIMNITGNSISLAYLGNYGLSYINNDNIPNPWAMNPNPYYQGNPPLTFSNIPRLMAYPFSNMVSIGIAAIRGSQGVQMFVMIPPIIVLVGRFFIGNMVPY